MDGMAIVYKAKCHVLNRHVAVKVLKDEFTTDEEFVKRFNIEAQSAASLTHPNIVSVYDVGNEGNLYYIVMELIKGKTLKEIIVEDGILGWKWSVKIAIQIASALETAHRNNLVHRDIKPHNIIITEDGIAKVTDFGIAKAVSNSTITAFGSTIGSVHYFSPEHARGGFTDEKSDLYSLGVVLYEMVTGRVPFDADTPVSVALKHMQEEAVEASIINPDIPISVNQIIIKAMQKDVTKRYGSATEIIKDLNMAIKNPDSHFVRLEDFATKVVKSEDVSNEDEDEAEVKDAENKKVNKKGKKRKFAKIRDFFDEHRALKVVALILLAILVFSLAMGGTFMALTMGRAKEVQIPDLSNLTLKEAESKAKELKLKVEVEEEKFHVEIEEGKIISQNPKYQKNFAIKEGTTIKVIISKGQEIVKVPKVLLETKDDAAKMLRDLGLIVEIAEEYNDEVEKNYVIEQSIAEGEEILAGSTITLKVSLGIEQVQVPELTNKTEAEAKKLIADNKLKYKATTKTKDSGKPNGVVVDQTITPGSLVDKDTEISITVNEFDEIKTATITINVSTLLSYVQRYDEYTGDPIPPRDVPLRVLVDGEQVESRSVKENSTGETVRFDAKGTVDVTVIIDGSQKAKRTLNLNNSTAMTIE